MNRTTQAASAILILLAAGCVAPPDLKPLDVANTIDGFERFTWPEPFWTDGTGEPTTPASDWGDLAQMPRFVEMTVPQAGAEPNLGVTKSGAVYVTAFDRVYRTEDFGKSYALAHDFVSPTHPNSIDYWSTGDPMLWVDPDTDRIFSSHLHPGTLCSYLAFSDQGRLGSWTERPMSCASPLIDHQKIATAKPGPRGTPRPGSSYPNVLYQCVNKLLDIAPELRQATAGTWCSTSFDSGLTWAYDRQVQYTPNCPAINGHPAAHPDGTIIVPIGTNWNTDCPRPVTVSLSEDNGLTWTARSMPGTMQDYEIDPDLTITPDGTAYLMFRGQDHIMYLARSKDKFQTWEGPWRVTPKEHTLGVFSVMTSGDDGRISLAYLGTRTDQPEDASPSDVVPYTEWHLFVTTVFGAGTGDPKFLHAQVSPSEDPVQMGCIWFRGGAGGPMQCRNLLDFNDMVSDKNGRVYVAITDGCTPRNGCSGNKDGLAGQSRDSQVSLVVQTSGWSLRSSVGTVEPVSLERARPFQP